MVFPMSDYPVGTQLVDVRFPAASCLYGEGFASGAPQVGAVFLRFSCSFPLGSRLALLTPGPSLRVCGPAALFLSTETSLCFSFGIHWSLQCIFSSLRQCALQFSARLSRHELLQTFWCSWPTSRWQSTHATTMFPHLCSSDKHVHRCDLCSWSRVRFCQWCPSHSAQVVCSCLRGTAAAHI